MTRRSKVQKQKVDRGKRLSLADSRSTADTNEYPSISLRFLAPTHCIKVCDRDDRSNFADKVRTLTQLTWSQLYSSHRHGAGVERIERSSLRVPIPVNVTDDTGFIAARFSGMKAMVGYRDGSTFYVLWFDRDFSVYNH